MNDNGFVTGTDAAIITRACPSLDPWASSTRCQASVVGPEIENTCARALPALR